MCIGTGFGVVFGFVCPVGLWTAFHIIYLWGSECAVADEDGSSVLVCHVCGFGR